MKAVMHELGAGFLGWMADERRTDRYGTVTLRETVDDRGRPIGLQVPDSLVGRPGTLIAVELNAAPPRGFASIRDALDGFGADEIVLGVGTLFVDAYRDGTQAVGVHPADRRKTPWLDPNALSRCHHKAVALMLRTFDSNAADNAGYVRDVVAYLDEAAMRAGVAIREIGATAAGEGTWDPIALAMRALASKVLQPVTEVLQHFANQCGDYDDPIIDDAGDDLMAVCRLLDTVSLAMGRTDARTDSVQIDDVAAPEVRAAKEAALRRLLGP